MWRGFYFFDGDSERYDWYEKWKRFRDYHWVFKDGHGTGCCIILSNK